MAGNSTTTATARAEVDHKAIVLRAFDHIDRTRYALAMLSDLTDGSESIHLTDEAIFGFKQLLFDAVDELHSARETLEQITYAPQKLYREKAGAD